MMLGAEAMGFECMIKRFEVVDVKQCHTLGTDDIFVLEQGFVVGQR